MEGLYTPKELASMMKLSYCKIMQMLRDREIESCRVGRGYRVPESALRGYMERTVTNGKEAVCGREDKEPVP